MDDQDPVPLSGRSAASAFVLENPDFSVGRGDLIDHIGAGPLLRTVRWAVHEQVYPYQYALQGKAGPQVVCEGRSMLSFSSYDYLGLIGHPDIEAAAHQAIDHFGTGSGGVRLLTGTTQLHEELESELAAFKGTEAAMCFSSGYMANLAALSALLGPRDQVLYDSRVHRSILDGIGNSRANKRSFPHNDMPALESLLKKPWKGRRFVVVEGVYSMDGDCCPLPDLVRLKERYGAFLMVDEAHSFGVMGETGRGIDEHFGVPPTAVDLWVGTLSKAIPSNGGFIAGKRSLIVYLQHGSRPFVFSAALCPSATGAALAALRVVRSEPQRRVRMREAGQHLRSALQTLRFDTGQSETPIIPVVLGEDENAYRVANKLFEAGIFVTPVVFPAVAKGQARLRLCVTAAHSSEAIEALISFFASYRGQA